MPNQADFDRVMRCVIEPLKRHFNAEFDPATIDDFVKALAKYSEQTLGAAMPDVIAENKRRPTMAHVIDACKKAIPQSTGGMPSPSDRFPWHERAERVEKLVGDYLQQFKTISTAWAEAKREGWSLDLWRYVHAVASVQAQMIVGEKNIGWNGVDIFGASTQMTDEMRRGFLSDQRRQAETGHIDVAIPTSRIEQWKISVTWRSKQKPIESSINARPATNLNPGLDEYIAARVGAP